MKRILCSIYGITIICLIAFMSAICLTACNSDDYSKQITPNEHTVTIQSSLMQGLSFSGGETTQTVADGGSITPISISAEYGYKYLYYKVDNTCYCSNTISLENVNKIQQLMWCVNMLHMNSQLSILIPITSQFLTNIIMFQ